ncbi:MAG: protein kinase [Planctomycetes bacterium]|nr:protein kinase [Planctomycetota bacterium]
MSSPSSTQDPNDQILVEFMAELEKRGSVVLEEYVRRYPDRAEEFAGFLQMHDAIDDTREAFGESVPQRLGDFRIVRLVARGGMGEVYEAVQEHLGRRVAIKVIRRGRVSGQARERFLREQKVLARLHQTHIVPIHFAGEEGRLQYFVMPYIEGSALHHVVRTAQQLDSTQAGDRTPTLAELAVQVAPASGDAVKEGEEVPATIEPRGEEHPAGGAQESPPLRLSPAYFRSVAAVMADAAEAVQHAHGDGVLHRDLKPSNLMVDRQGQCWLIDFGLAAFVREVVAPGEPRKELRSPEPATASGVLGTVEYMSPEQLEGKVDVRTDVWGLGATLYELVTLSRAFEAPGVLELCAKIRTGEPTAPRRLVANVPHDLEAICRKALRKAPNQRYPTAGAFAEDLRRWLRHEPTIARPARVPRRVWLWTLRNPGWAIALVMTLLVVLGLGAGGILWQVGERRAAEQRERESRRQTLLLELQQRRTTPHTVGWRDNAWDLVRQIAEFRTDSVLQSQAVATLAGPDARPRKHLRHGASALAWDREGKRLLMGAPKKGTASLWESGRDEEIRFEQGGQGPVAFRADGTPLQLVANPKDRWSVRLWDLGKGRPIREFQIPPRGKPEPATALNSMQLAMTGDGTFVAAATTAVDKQGNLVEGHLAAWDAGTGKLLVEAEAKATALALSPDGALLAAGDEEGRIRFWALTKGKELEPLRSGQTEIHAFAFGRNLHRPEARPDDGPTASWLLASGQAGGTVTVWDLRTRQVTSRSSGSYWDVYTLAFSPDGMTLASAGRDTVNLWDAATGRLLLTGSRQHDYATGVAFSPDGRRLAVSSEHVAAEQSAVVVYELDLGRGMQTLRGLVGQIAQVRFSPNGRWVAALSHNWQVALWDSKANRLLHVLEVPQGLFADNADLCFSPDGGRFAFVTGRQAKLWEVQSGEELGSWDLPHGLADRLAFRSKDELVLFRIETASGLPPVGAVPWREHPRVCRIRHLTRPKQIKRLAEIKEFNKYISGAVISPDGSSIVAAGEGGPDGKRRTVRIYDGTTGKEVGILPVDRTDSEIGLYLDVTGKILAYQPTNGAQATLVDVPSGEVRGVLPYVTRSLGPGAKHWVGSLPSHQPGLTLVRRQDGKQLFMVGIDSAVHTGPFSADGTRWALGHTDGSVTVCDLPGVQRHLTEIDLGW